MATLNGDDVQLSEIEELLHVKMDSNTIIAPTIDLGPDEEPVFYGEIDWLLGLVEKNKEELIRLGVDFAESEIWMIYFYEKQCNMEFDASILERMGTLGLHLCVSCQKIG